MGADAIEKDEDGVRSWFRFSFGLSIIYIEELYLIAPARGLYFHSSTIERELYSRSCALKKNGNTYLPTHRALTNQATPLETSASLSDVWSSPCIACGPSHEIPPSPRTRASSCAASGIP